MDFKNKTILVTGGTGSFGKAFTDVVLKNMTPKKIIIFSRDEYKQFEMAKQYPGNKYPIRFFLGDIRDKERLFHAFEDVDYVIHAAALKQVPALEYNPFEAVKTNIVGTQNVVEAAIKRGVKRVVAISSDKAVIPINLYGASKMAMEKIIISANSYVGKRDLRFCCVRYGNVIGSRGSIIPFFLKLKRDGVQDFPVTDEKMTRFWITLDQGVNLVFETLAEMAGGEIFVPKIPSMKIIDLIKAIDNHARYHIVGIRPGEKIHETLIHEDEGRNTIDNGEYYVIRPQFLFETKNIKHYNKATPVSNGFIYRSDSNKDWLTAEQLQIMIETLPQ